MLWHLTEIPCRSVLSGKILRDILNYFDNSSWSLGGFYHGFKKEQNYTSRDVFHIPLFPCGFKRRYISVYILLNISLQDICILDTKLVDFFFFFFSMYVWKLANTKWCTLMRIIWNSGVPYGDVWLWFSNRWPREFQGFVVWGEFDHIH